MEVSVSLVRMKASSVKFQTKKSGISASFPNEAVEVLTEKDHRLLNLTQLSTELNASYDFVKDMRKMGFELPIGGMTTLTFAMAWLNQNPNFREDARILKLSSRPKRRAHPQHLAAGRFDAPQLKHG